MYRITFSGKMTAFKGSHSTWFTDGAAEAGVPLLPPASLSRNGGVAQSSVAVCHRLI